MGDNALKKMTPVTDVVCGVLSKKEAALKISKSQRHIHSSAAGEKDPQFQITKKWSEGEGLQSFDWETGPGVAEATIDSSAERYNLIHDITQKALGKRKSSLRLNMESVLEELITNAIYHAYRKKDGSEKYSRTRSIKLQESEKITVRYRSEAGGIYLSVSDQGGNLRFEEIANTFERCYGSTAQIENKEGGAGLGMYMIFECVTHLKIERTPGKKTVVSCWISGKKSSKQEAFSFNFFERS